MFILHNMTTSWAHKKSIFTLYFLVLTLLGYGQQTDIEKLYNEGINYSQQGKYVLSNIRFNKILKKEPLNTSAHSQLAWNKLLLKDITKSEKHANTAFYLNQANYHSLALMGYLLIEKGELDKGKEYLKYAIQIAPNDSEELFIRDFKDLAKLGANNSFFTEGQDWINKVFESKKYNVNLLESNLFKSADQFKANKGENTLLKAMLDLDALPSEFNFYKAYTFNTIGEGLQNRGHNLIALKFHNKANELSQSLSGKNSFIQISTVRNKMSIYLAERNYTQIIQLYNQIEPTLINVDKIFAYFLNYITAEIYVKLGEAYVGLNKLDKQKEIAKKLMTIKNTPQDEWYLAWALNLSGSAYLISSTPNDRLIAKHQLEQALEITQIMHYKALKSSIISNLAISYWQQGEQQKGIDTYQELSNEAIINEDYLNAEGYLNNLGTMLYFNNEYAQAAIYFKKAIAITEKYRKKLDDTGKLTFMQSRISAYKFLTTCLVKTKNSAALFEAQEAERGRLLKENLSLNNINSSISLNDFQSKLKSDEVAIFYTLMETGAVTLNVITPTSSKAIYHEKFDSFIAFKNKYLVRIKDQYKSKKGYKPALMERKEGGVTYLETDKARLLNAEDFEMLIEFSRELLQQESPLYSSIRKEFFTLLYDFLIAPAYSSLVGKKKILISPDGLLNFIPFEALIDNNENFLVQDYEVSYIQSASIYNILLERNYSQERKSMIAFGGATFEKMNTEATQIRGINRLNKIQNLVKENIKTGESMRAAYAALGFGKMNYLKGTLLEVNAIAKIVNEPAIFTGTQMTESFLKSISKSGELANYKVVHFATHGFAVPSVPQLSGIAMCIFANEHNHQDGYLTVNELANLRFKADIAVLSACETGLGKIYGGEGVFGLTQALLTAGANQALVSLWPVSDEGTMYFMTGMYKLVEEQNFSFSKASTIMKRKFINGEYGPRFAEPNYWAPFIHFGK